LSCDFHFYNNFLTFKSPVGAAVARAKDSLDILDVALLFLKQQPPFPGGGDLDDAHDWLMVLNDGMLEQFTLQENAIHSSVKTDEFTF
jgi:exosome complex exonuclease RRP6